MKATLSQQKLLKPKKDVSTMNISITGHHITITDAMKDMVTDKLSKVERHFDQIQSIKVILSLDNNRSDTSNSGKNNHKAEALMRVAGQEMFVQSNDDDMYKAIHEMADKLDRQVRKYKTRMDRKTRASKRKARLELPVVDTLDESFAY